MRFGARLVVLGSIGLGAACAWACLPDLVVATPSHCGDGYVDPDAGETCDPGEAGASSAACPHCRMACSGTGGTSFLDPASNHCYFDIPGQSSKSLEVSEQACAAASAHLVRIVSDQEMTTVASGSPLDGYWIGLRGLALPSYVPAEPTSIEPGWSPTCSGCYARLDDGGADAAPVECLAATKTASAPWTRVACLGAAKEPGHVTLCEQEPPGSRAAPCFGGGKLCFSVPATLGGAGAPSKSKPKRYVLIQKVATFADASSACAALGGSLVAFDSREEREQVAAVVAPLASDLWLALARDPQGSWGWDAGLPPAAVWGVDQPTDAGARAFLRVRPGDVDSSLVWVDADTAQHYPLCQL